MKGGDELAVERASRAELRLMQIERKKKHEDAIRQKAFDRGYREGYSAGRKDHPISEEP